MPRPTLRTPPTPDQIAAGWAFVLAHRRTIDRLCGKLLGDPRIDFADLRQEAAIQCARAHRGYQPERSAPVTWIWWRVRRARQALLERRNRIDANEQRDAVVDGQMMLLQRSDDGRAAIHAYRMVLVAQTLDRATPAEVAAARSVLGDVPENVLPALLGLTPAERDHRLRRLGATLSE